VPQGSGVTLCSEMAELTLERGAWAEVPQAVQFAVRGQMTVAGVGIFKTAIDAAVVGQASILLLGLREVPFLPSITLSYLADLVVRLQQRGGGIVLVGADAKVKMVLASLGLVQFFHFHDDFGPAREFAKGLARQLAQQPRLLIARGPGEGQEYPIAGTVAIGGADDATIRIRAQHIQPKHAEVYAADGRCYVKDLGSKMGTYVGKKKVATQALVDGDVIRIVDFELRFLAAGGG